MFRSGSLGQPWVAIVSCRTRGKYRVIAAVRGARVKVAMTDKLVVLVTCGSAKEARRIAKAVVEQKLAACVNILDARVHSIYRWKGRVESAREFLLVMKTSRRRFAAAAKEDRAASQLRRARDHRAADCRRGARLSRMDRRFGAIVGAPICYDPRRSRIPTHVALEPLTQLE